MARLSVYYLGWLPKLEGYLPHARAITSPFRIAKLNRAITAGTFNNNPAGREDLWTYY
jgi:hypothetical protein